MCRELVGDRKERETKREGQIGTGKIYVVGRG